MKICRFNNDRLGLVHGRNIQDVTEAANSIPPAKWPAPHGDMLVRHLGSVVSEIHKLRDEAETLSFRDLHLNSPIANPTKIIGSPLNYMAHKDEMNREPNIGIDGQPIKSIETYGLFLKSPVPVGPGDGVQLRFEERRTDHEVELAMIIGKECRNISEEEALNYVAGYTIGLDMTIRGMEDRSLRKAVDTYSLLGPWLVTAGEIEDPDNLDISLSVNGMTRQSSNTREMIYSTRKLISFASSYYTLYPGDVIMSGTPEGVSQVSVGDVLECMIEKIGTMTVTISQYKAEQI